MNILKPILVAAAICLLAGCATLPSPSSLASLSNHAATAPSDRFLAAIARHCGQAFAGRVVTNVPKPSTPDAFEGKPLIMHVRGCDEPQKQLRIPFHVGDDRSRTWVLTRTPQGVQLKHDHRHEDGSPDATMMYGGDTADAGTASRQVFPVDAESIVLFQREGLAASVTNTWAMEIVPGQRFLYELSRPNGRLFQVEFDLTRPISVPRLLGATRGREFWRVAGSWEAGSEKAVEPQRSDIDRSPINDHRRPGAGRDPAPRVPEASKPLSPACAGSA